jgi:hypothetical protein
MQEQLREVRSVFEGHLKSLEKQAAESAIRFENFTVRENTIRTGWKDQNTLKFRVRLEGNALMLEWYRRIWMRDESGKRDTQHSYIRKRGKSKSGSSYSYVLDDLFKYAPEWSRDMVVEVESEAATLRRQARYCAAILVSLGRLERYLVQLEAGGDLPEEEEA